MCLQIMCEEGRDFFLNRMSYIDGNSQECPFKNVLGRNVLLLFVLTYTYVLHEKTKRKRTSRRRTFLKGYCYN
jgi:hypothetical protein